MSRFDHALRQAEDERHVRITADLTPTYASSLPRGWRAEDVLHQRGGFLALRDAAEAMAISEEHVFEMACAGLLEHDGRGCVRPAIVSLLGVRDER